jgi:ABC-type multidrug transport system ATPase subunit
MTASAISVRHLARTFGARTVLRDVTFDVPAGSVLCLVGANGSGKTTLLEILATVLAPTSGRVSIHGLDVTKKGTAVRRLVGYGLSTLHSFYPQLSARQNLEFFAAVHGLAAREARARTSLLLDGLGLRDAASSRVQEFSDGMTAKLSVARALVADPPVLLLDEPTKSLDDEARQTVREMAVTPTARRAPRSVVWTTHDHTEAFALGDAVCLLDEGEVRSIGGPARVTAGGRMVTA